jgi:tRNA (guanine-N7-)-methyltransferase
MEAKSRVIETNQSGLHERLEETVRKHLASPFLKPIADHTRHAFESVQQQVLASDAPTILDSCCGVGDSSRNLATEFPDHLVIGVDKSDKRLSTERDEPRPENMVLVRADLNDFFRLAVEAGWQPDRHYILYPNPWPKSVHLGRRWHGAPVFPSIIELGGLLELRSNWRLYLEEFQAALKVAGHKSRLSPFEPESYLTPFEKKYHQSGQILWKLEATL